MAVLGVLSPSTVLASDNMDGSRFETDRIADLADLYVWPSDDDMLIAVITFGVHSPDDVPALDPNVLYTLHIDNTADPYFRGYWLDPLPAVTDLDAESDIQIYIRFGRTADGDWGMQVQNLPGANQQTLAGMLDRPIDGGRGTHATYGIYDNPFFFDIEGYRQTLVNLEDDNPDDLAFGSVLNQTPVDGYAGTNVHAVALQFSLEQALGGNDDNFLMLWATASRIPPLETSGETDSDGDTDTGTGTDTDTDAASTGGTGDR